jgi:hypothetical protein
MKEYKLTHQFDLLQRIEVLESLFSETHIICNFPTREHSFKVEDDETLSTIYNLYSDIKDVELTTVSPTT